MSHEDRQTPATYFCGNLAEIGNITADHFQKINKVSEIISGKETDFLTLETMLHQQLGNHDVFSESHSYRTSQSAYESFLQIDPEFSAKTNPDDIKIGGLLHDIGKLCIDKNILTNPDSLTKKEVDTIKLHPFFSYQMLKDAGLNQTVLDIALYHHEKWDGSGYPCGFKGEEIPKAARIFAVIDVWDALISERPYRSAIPHEEALKMMMGEKFVGFFEPKILFKFVQSKGYLLKSDDLQNFIKFHKN